MTIKKPVKTAFGKQIAARMLIGGKPRYLGTDTISICPAEWDDSYLIGSYYWQEEMLMNALFHTVICNFEWTEPNVLIPIPRTLN